MKKYLPPTESYSSRWHSTMYSSFAGEHWRKAEDDAEQTGTSPHAYLITSNKYRETCHASSSKETILSFQTHMFLFFLLQVDDVKRAMKGGPNQSGDSIMMRYVCTLHYQILLLRMSIDELPGSNAGRWTLAFHSRTRRSGADGALSLLKIFSWSIFRSGLRETSRKQNAILWGGNVRFYLRYLENLLSMVSEL